MPGFIQKQGNFYKVDFDYSKWAITNIKAIPGRYFDAAKKVWMVPVAQEPELQKFASRHKLIFMAEEAPEIIGDIKPLPELTIDVKLKAPWVLRHYQANGVAYNLQHERVLIGDDMGTGKTIQAIASVMAFEQVNKDAFPVLVICGDTLKANWKFEWESATDKKAIILSENCKRNFHLYHEAGVGDVFIVNYDSIKKYFVRSIDKPTKGRVRLDQINFQPSIEMFKTIIIDESHRVKDPTTLRTKFCRGIAEGKKYRLLLSGTAAVNGPKDVAVQLSILGQLHKFGGWTKFMTRYCSGPNRQSNLKELGFLMSEMCYYRRETEEVLTELPEKTRNKIYCDITTRAEYNAAERDLAEYMRSFQGKDKKDIDKSMRAEVMVRIGILKNISARGKVKEVTEFVQDVIDQGQKIVMFGFLRKVMDMVKHEFPESLFMTGAETKEEAESNKHEFQKCKTCNVRLERHDHDECKFIPSDVKLITLNMESNVEGHTLTAARQTAWIEIPWTAKNANQGEARVHRMSQVNATQHNYFLGKDTIDDYLYDIVTRKRNMMNDINNHEDSTQEEIISGLMDLFNQRNEVNQKTK